MVIRCLLDKKSRFLDSFHRRIPSRFHLSKLPCCFPSKTYSSWWLHQHFWNLHMRKSNYIDSISPMFFGWTCQRLETTTQYFKVFVFNQVWKVSKLSKSIHPKWSELVSPSRHWQQLPNVSIQMIKPRKQSPRKREPEKSMWIRKLHRVSRKSTPNANQHSPGGIWKKSG